MGGIIITILYYILSPYWIFLYISLDILQSLLFSTGNLDPEASSYTSHQNDNVNFIYSDNTTNRKLLNTQLLWYQYSEV